MKIRYAKRTKGGWKLLQDSEATVEEVGMALKAVHGKSVTDVFEQTKVGRLVISSYSGTLSELIGAHTLAGWTQEEQIAWARK